MRIMIASKDGMPALELIIGDMSFVDKIKFCRAVFLNKSPSFYSKTITINLETRNKEIQEMIERRMEDIKKHGKK